MTPVPERLADCGDPEALSATTSVALKLAAEAGVKSMEMVQLAEAAKVAPQVVAVCAKSLELLPPRVMPVTVSVAVPGLDSVTV